MIPHRPGSSKGLHGWNGPEPVYPDEKEQPYGATVKDGALLVELAAREAGRRKHKSWQRVSAADLIVVLEELGFKIVVWP